MENTNMENESGEIKKKRVRRTKKDLEQRLFDAALAVIAELGFANLTIKALTKKAEVEPPVFYNRYKDLNDFLEKFVRKYDYWTSDNVNFRLKEDPVENITNLIIGLTDSLIDNDCMQRLLAWEIGEDNYITRRTAQNRDANSRILIEYFNQAFKKCGVSFNFSTAVIIGGIYYLILHRERGTFNFVDYTKKGSIDELKKNVRLMLKKIFNDCSCQQLPTNIDPKIIEIAKKLIENNVDREVIKNSTGLNDETLSMLYS